ncbi:ATP-binding protein [Oxalobacter vibrioformis]|uniref:histidine kinase n=1 Tax=Oxalobacter vibrioformis TaxID=933080 RepID=A0A9E9P221_9BURK|nr:ATP-binding protein [Oxalobacter vibrioformis]WAW09419.1 ATP-binding protein [Oxalobacter vibrioformis]
MTPSSNKRPPSRWSLQLRLSAFFTLAVTIAWLFAAAFAWFESAEYIDEFFDTQQLLFAKRLAASDLKFAPRPEGIPAVFSNKKAKGEVEEEALRFAIFSPNGDLLMSDGISDERFCFRPGMEGFEDATMKGNDDLWRIVWQPAVDHSFIVAVGQKKEYRQEMALELLEEQMMPWIVMLPILAVGLIIMVRRELSPLRMVKNELENRQPGNAAPLPAEQMPPEIRPLVLSLNSHFERVASLLERERAFIADAAHELRTPLAGLRIQAEVAQLSENDPEALNTALKNLISGIDRSSRLADQLLALSRIEGMQALSAAGKEYENATPVPEEAIHWPEVVNEAVSEYLPLAEKKGITMLVSNDSLPPPVNTQPALPRMLMRNLLDNAVRYAPENSEVRIILKTSGITMENTGPALPDEAFSRLGERFYRPPGQAEPGSGLGLSIVHQLAGLLRITVFLEKKDTDNPGQIKYIAHIRPAG